MLSLSLELNVVAQMNYYAQILFSVMLCMLAIIQSIQMYRLTKQWELNQYINILVKQGVIYFLALLPLNFINLLGFWNVIPGFVQYSLLMFLEYVPVFTLAPRFIISIREIHDHDVQGRRGGGIDSGFGLSTLSDRDATRSEQVVFASRDENEPGGNTVAAENMETNVGQDDRTENIQMVPRDVESGLR
ncbi:hypothetical protein JVU11DRAFT_7364 [Chiua virens]|nr:hypothetical protein JVU11DRAFT_7364 [Chiua virens]